MARLASLSKLGYYPTPQPVIDILTTLFTAEPGAYAFDPFAGRGTALLTLAAAHSLVPHANELHDGRFDELSKQMNAFWQRQQPAVKQVPPTYGAAEYLEVDGLFGLVFSNPPYHMGTELALADRAENWAAVGGIIVHVLPDSCLTVEWLQALLTWFEDVRVRRFPDGYFDQFNQVVVFGRRRKHQEVWPRREARQLQESLQAKVPVLTAHEFTYRIPKQARPAVKAGHGVVLQAIQADLDEEEPYGAYCSDSWRFDTAPEAARPFMAPLEEIALPQAATLVAAGALENVTITLPDGTRALLRSRSEKHIAVEHRTKQISDGKGGTKDYKTTKARDQFRVDLVVLKVDGPQAGEIHVHKNSEQDYHNFVAQNADAILQAVRQNYPPRFDEEKLRRRWSDADLARIHPPGVLPGNDGEVIMPNQIRAAAALAYAMRQGDSVTAISGDKPGIGKTLDALLADYLYRCEKWQRGDHLRTVVFCPANMTKKWAAQAQTCLREFNVKAFICKTTGDVDRAFAHPGPAYLIVSHSMGKRGAGWELQYLERGYLTLPHNGKYRIFDMPEGVVVDPVSGHTVVEFDAQGNPKFPSPQDWLYKDGKPRKRRTDFTVVAGHKKSSRARVGYRHQDGRVIGSPLYQMKALTPPTPLGKLMQDMRFGDWVDGRMSAAVEHKPATRYPLGAYLKRRYHHQFFLIVDELHKGKGGTTDIGYTVAALIAGAEKTIGLTSTLFGGKATMLFHLLYRMGIRGVRGAYGDTDENRFIEDYGAWERDFDGHKTADECATWNYNRQRGRKNSFSENSHREIPGIHPAMLGLLLPSVVFRSFERDIVPELGEQMPDLREEVYIVEEHKALRPGLVDLQAAQEEASKQARFSVGAWGKVGPVSTGWPNAPERDEEIDLRYGDNLSKGGFFTVQGISLPDGMTNKDVVIIDLILHHLQRGRRCLCFSGQNRKRDSRPRFKAALERQGVKVAVLDAEDVRPAERTEWLRRQVENGVGVVLTSAGMFEMGVDLLDWPNIIFRDQCNYSLFQLEQASGRHWRPGQTRDCNTYYVGAKGTMEERVLANLSAKQAAARAMSGDLGAALAMLTNDGSDDLRRTLLESQFGREIIPGALEFPTDDVDALRQKLLARTPTRFELPGTIHRPEPAVTATVVESPPVIRTRQMPLPRPAAAAPPRPKPSSAPGGYITWPTEKGQRVAIDGEFRKQMYQALLAGADFKIVGHNRHAALGYVTLYSNGATVYAFREDPPREIILLQGQPFKALLAVPA
jgi:hypothetical protein